MNYIESINNPKVKQWRKLLTKKERDKSKLFLIEGFHLVEEALKESDRIVDIVVSESIDIPKSWDISSVRLTIVTDQVMKQIVDTKTPQGIVAVCRQTDDDLSIANARSFILIDAVQDPGNVGTIIRTADAAGVDVVIVGEGSADIYQPKVVRSSQGSHFHIKIVKGNLKEWLAKLRNENVTIYGTSLQNGKVYEEVSEVSSFALLVGNEGSGVSAELLSLTDKNLYIPIYGKSESLNVAVATGILTYHLKSKLN